LLIRHSKYSVGKRSQNRNLLRNPSFNVTNEQTGFVASWSCQGERIGFIPMVQTVKSSKSKPFAGLCTQRTSFEQGPSTDIREIFIPYHIY